MIFGTRIRGRGARNRGGAELSTAELLEEIESLTAEDQIQRAPELERRLLALRHLTGLRLTSESAGRPKHPSPDFERLPGGSALPEARAPDVTPEMLRAAILRSGCLLVRGAVVRSHAAGLTERIDRAFEAREAHTSGGSKGDGYYEDFVPDPRFDLGPERMAISDASNLLGPDSPRVMTELFEIFEQKPAARAGAGVSR